VVVQAVVVQVVLLLAAAAAAASDNCHWQGRCHWEGHPWEGQGSVAAVMVVVVGRHLQDGSIGAYE
jgi:hypothetical protein